MELLSDEKQVDVQRGIQTSLGTILGSTFLEESAMLTWTIPVNEEGGEILRLRVQTMQRKDDKWGVSVPLFLSRMSSISSTRSSSELAHSPT